MSCRILFCEKMYKIIEFEDGLQLVPIAWLNDDSTHCAWPNYTNQLKINKAISSIENTDASWKLHKVVRIFGSADTYVRGVEKLKLAEMISDVESSFSEGGGSRTKVRQKRAKRSYSSSDESENEPASVQLPVLPKPPQFENTVNVFPSTSTAISGLNVNSQEHSPKNGMAKVNANTDLSTGMLVFTGTLSLYNLQLLLFELNHLLFTSFSEFQKHVLKKLNQLLNAMSQMEERIKNIESSLTTKDDNEVTMDTVDLQLPCVTIEKFIEFDTSLCEQGHLKKVVNILKHVGGGNVHDIIINLMKRLMEDEVAEQFSWVGAKGKKPFKDLKARFLILETLLAHGKQSTEVKVGHVVARWLVQAKLRLQRKNEKISRTPA
ncbi:uncharacterized protein LOC134527147 isoform X1 [Bacillus rossius redtenbacheri]|uniref:uncharacterized protein LOC134527147 isoform X1 n=1 Tax=Bacillus rossius redtenbacheri TaxID=93214 RepID=UPI002FDD2F36